MNAAGAERRALRPVWMLATGAALGALVGMAVEAPASLGPAATVTGAIAIVAVLLGPRRWLLWLVAGLAIAWGRSVGAGAERATLAAAVARAESAALRLTATVHDGWVPTRWGLQARVTVSSARHGDREVPMSGRWRLEVRGAPLAGELPPPGATFTALAAIRGDAQLPFLAVASARLMETIAGPHGLPALRDRLATTLLASAGTRVRRIRAAELTAALVLGRRDLLTRERRDGWRRSGLAHLLAVSGLHVGLVAGVLWVTLNAAGLHPRRVRWLMLAAIPGYAVLAGAAPSAVRAALMAVVYLSGRQLGRAVIPMASVLLAATALLLANPALVTDAGFQLTVLVTAALVRWVPATAAVLPGSRRSSQIAAVPLIAQTAAAPIAAAHFRVAVPGAAAANLLIPLLLAPTLTAALVAVALAPIWPGGAALLLDLLGVCERMIWLCGVPGRMAELALPSMPVEVMAAFVVTGWLALQPGRPGLAGAASWCAVIAAGASCWLLLPPSAESRVELLEIADGLSATVVTRNGTVLVDGGRWRLQAAELLADRSRRRIAAVVASHPDEDHIGGLRRVLETADVARLVIPVWARSSVEMAPLLTTARERGIELCPVSRGSVVRFGDTAILVVWPPARLRSGSDNDRSLVVRIVSEDGAVLVGADIDRGVEARLARGGHLESAVLVVPHHGSRGSGSEALLDATSPEVILIPAGPLNRHNHPHTEVLGRLERRGIPYRYPARDGPCGAAFLDGRWEPFPAAAGD